RNLMRNFISGAPPGRIEWRDGFCGRRRESIALPWNRFVSRSVIGNPADWFGVEYVAFLADVDLGFEMRNLEVIVALLQHPPKRHVWIVEVLHQIQRGHAERISLYLERSLVAVKGFSCERIDLGDLFVGHRVAAGRGAAAMDHDVSAGSAVCAVVGIGIAD